MPRRPKQMFPSMPITQGEPLTLDDRRSRFAVQECLYCRDKLAKALGLDEQRDGRNAFCSIKCAANFALDLIDQEMPFCTHHRLYLDGAECPRCDDEDGAECKPRRRPTR